MKIDDEVLMKCFLIIKLRAPVFLLPKSILDLHHADPVSHILGADSSLEHNKSLHFCHEGEMFVGGYRCG